MKKVKMSAIERQMAFYKALYELSKKNRVEPEKEKKEIIHGEIKEEIINSMPNIEKEAEVFLNEANKIAGFEKPCNFDHNGECLVCDCWPLSCAFVRYLNKDYTYETKEELEAMFPDIEKYKEYVEYIKPN